MRVPIQGQTMSLDEPMRWLEESGLVSVDAALREADSDRQRIEAVLDRFPEGSSPRAILEGYHEHLMQRTEAGRTSLRSIRLSLSPAASLLAFADDMKRMPPDQRALDGFLSRAPWPSRRRRRRKLEAEMLALMREGGKDGKTERDLRKRWLSAALAYFHDLPVKAGRNVGDEDVTADEGGMTVRIGGSSYWIPHPGSGEGHPAP